METTMDAENLCATELRLGLPGTSGTSHDVDGNIRSNKSSTVGANKRTLDDTRSDASATAAPAAGDGQQDDTATPPAKAQVVGWPPVRAHRKNAVNAAAAAKKAEQSGGGSGLYVKVSMDGAPYLRKVDLRTYGGYRELREALDALFFTRCFVAGDRHQYEVAYEDKDGDLMLVGDVPWDMFVSSCKKLRIIKGSAETR